MLFSRLEQDAKKYIEEHFEDISEEISKSRYNPETDFQIPDFLSAEKQFYIDDEELKQEDFNPENDFEVPDFLGHSVQLNSLTDINDINEGHVFAEKKNIVELFENMDESFADMLIRKIDQSGMKDSECYNRANINRSLFNRIINNPEYHVSKNNAIALALALKLNKKETDELISKAGYTLTQNSKFDLIIAFCIENKIYNIVEVNELLYKFDQGLLGSRYRE